LGGASLKFHERLKELRKQSPLMQKDIAAAVGVAVRTFQEYEAGQAEPNIERLIKLADIFDVPLDYLMGRSEE
jgi:transcriptional regulator with XRE-family HTH domain